jgi:FKBP-type peptidyl-prolyl cis-trans isomerase
MNNKFKTGVAVATGIVVVGLFFVFNDPLAVIQSQTASPAQAQLVLQDEAVGTGAVASAGDTVEVHYTGRLEDGTVFETSVGGEPIRFTLGTGEVIQGWEQGLIGMKEGGKRLLIIPPALAYGAVDYGPIPANSTLIFELELVNVEKGR